jgi:threonine/homoserine/homoserine lactone efflux protein
MDIASLILFATALFVAAATPGPGIAAIVARVLGRGPRGAVAFTAGVAIGDVVWLSVAVLGLAAVAQTFHGLFLVIKYAGCAYLAWLGWKLWTAPVVARADENALPQEGGVRLFLAGLAVTLGNPKVVVFYLALLPTLVDLKRVTVLGFAELAGVTLAVLGLVFSAYIVLAARARLLFTSPRAMRAVNKTTGAVMVGAAAAIAAR